MRCVAIRQDAEPDIALRGGDKSFNEPLRCVAFRRVALRGIVTLCGDKLTNEPLRFLSICCDATRSGAPRRHADRVAGKSFNEPLR